MLYVLISLHCFFSVIMLAPYFIPDTRIAVLFWCDVMMRFDAWENEDLVISMIGST